MRVMSTRQAVATRLRQARERAGLSQGQAAKLLGMHRPSVSEIEAGRRAVRAEELSAFAALYRVGAGWLALEPPDPLERRVEFAARELSKLNEADLEKLIELVQAFRGAGEP